MPRDIVVAKNLSYVASSFYNTPSQPQHAAADLISDPPLGEVYAFVSSAKPEIKSGRAILLVPVGECASCLGVNLKKWIQSAKERDLNLTLLTSATRSDAATFQQSLKIDVPTLFDADLSLKRRLNIAWLGRPYLFSSDGRLLWLAKRQEPFYDPFKDPEFLTALKGVER